MADNRFSVPIMNGLLATRLHYWSSTISHQVERAWSPQSSCIPTNGLVKSAFSVVGILELWMVSKVCSSESDP